MLSKRPVYCWLVCLLIVIATMLWPGDNHWGGDDVDLIRMATQANDHHTLVHAGLGGSFGYPYGPIPAQFYQLLCLISRDPVVLTVLRAGLFTAATVLALFYLADVLELSPWLVPLMMVGPFFWFYARLLWDNTFAIPIGTLLLASYGDYLRRPTRLKFFTAVVCAMTLPLIHFMTLPLAAAVAAHALLNHRDELKRRWVGLIVILLLFSISCGSYVVRVAHQIVDSPRLMQPNYDRLSRPAAFAYPLLSGRLFTAYGFQDARGPEHGLEQKSFALLAREISTISYGLFWIGLLVAIFRFKQPIVRICLIALCLQSLLDGCLKIPPFPHYYCGTWAAIVVILWLGIDSLKAVQLRLGVSLIYAVSMVICTIVFAIDIHHGHGGTVWYGPSIQATRP